MYEAVREKINAEFGSINRLAKALHIQSGDLYSAFKGVRPLYPKYRELIAAALGEDVDELFKEEEK